MNTKLLVTPNTEYLLSASLDSLHQETQEWMSEIAFWRDELAFFYKLLHKKESGKVFPSKDLAAIQKSLISISSELLEKVRESVRMHEKSLAQLLQEVSFSDEGRYRDAHRGLLVEVHGLHDAIRDFKRDLFSYLK